jgi:hypothetical protein
MGVGVVRDTPITAENNFEDFPHALLLLFGISSGENWDGYMKVGDVARSDATRQLCAANVAWCRHLDVDI